MKINGIDGMNTSIKGMNMLQSNDSVSKNIQNKIANAQKQLQDLSSNKEMSIEEKMKKRQEIQQQIADLNSQLRQHQITQRKEQQAKETSMNDMLGASKQTASGTGKRTAGLSRANMKAMISADSAMAQAKIQGSVAGQMEGKAGVLETEIKLDAARGVDVEKKKEELAEVEQKEIAAETAQLSTLADANKELEAATKEERQTKRVDEKNTKEEKTENKISGDAIDNSDVDNVINENGTEMTETEEPISKETASSVHVDVRV